VNSVHTFDVFSECVSWDATGARCSSFIGSRLEVKPLTIKRVAAFSRPTRHDVNGSAEVTVSGDVEAQRESLKSKAQVLIENEDANKPSLGERARTLAQQCTHGTLTTSSRRHGGWPFGSLVDYVLDDRGRPIFLLSYFASHTNNILDDSRCSLFLHPPATSPQADARVTLLGRCSEVPAGEIDSCRNQFLNTHQHYSEVENFNIFKFYRMDVAEVYYVAGFGSTARWVYSADYANARPDPLLDDNLKMVSEINKNRPEDVRRIATYFAGLKISEHDSVVVKSIDRLGFDIRVVYTEDKNTRELRIPFKTPDGNPVTERLLAQSALVHMALEAWESSNGLVPESECPTSAPRSREAILSYGDSELPVEESSNGTAASSNGTVVGSEVAAEQDDMDVEDVLRNSGPDINDKLDQLLARAVEEIQETLAE